MTILSTAWGGTAERRGHAGLAIALAMVVLLAAASGETSAQAPYPNRPIRLIVPYPPGAGTDFTGREVGAQFSKALGQSVVIDNRGGAAATSGTRSPRNRRPTVTRCCSARPAGSCPAPR